MSELESKPADLAEETGKRLRDANDEVSDSKNSDVKSDNSGENSAVSQNTDIMAELENENTPLSGDKHDDNK